MFSLLQELTVGQSVVVVICGVLLYVILISTYRLTFHPLAKYPGRFVCKISSWPFFLQTTRGDAHLVQAQEHEKYGPIVRIAPNTISFNTPSALQEIYSTRKANVRKSDWYKTVDAPSGAFSTHSELDWKKHASRRRVLDHAFSESALKSASTFVINNITAWLQRLGEKTDPQNEWSDPKQMSEWTSFLYYDITGDLAFGSSFQAIDRGECSVAKDVVSGGRFITPIGYLPFIRILRPFLRFHSVMGLLVGKAAQDEFNFFKYAAEQITSRIHLESQYAKSSTPARKDFVHYLLHAKDPATGRGFTQTELFADAAMLISAGGDTSSATLSALLFYLLRSPVALEKLTHEIRSTFTSIDEIQGVNLNPTTLPYTRACIEEALRLAPAVPAHLPRQVLPGGLSIDGHYFPAGTVIGTSAYAIHHDPSYFPAPYSFYPERWLADEASVALARSAFCPFTLGTRMCIGKNLAYMELTLTLARLLWTYDIRAADGVSGGGSAQEKHPGRRREGEYQLIDWFLTERYGPMMQFRRRNGIGTEF